MGEGIDERVAIRTSKGDATCISVRGGLIRGARRPAGWHAPGPLPRGPDGRIELEPADGEDLCYLTGEWRIFQRIDGHRWSLDDLVTAWFACRAVEGRPVARAVDLGCGIGSVLMMVAWRLPAARIVGIEAQAVSAALARRSLAYNGIDDRCEVRDGDLRDPAVLAERASFDLVTGTPPYFAFGRGRVSERVQCGPCRFESRGGIEAYCDAASRLLAPGGRFVACESADQVDRVMSAAAGAGLEVLARLDVVPREGRPPLVSVFEMAHAKLEPGAESGTSGDAEDRDSDAPLKPGAIVRGFAGLSVWTLVVRDRAGQWTPELRRLREEMGLPPGPPG